MCHVREDLLTVPVDLIHYGFGSKGGLLDHCAMRLDATSCTSAACFELRNMVDGGFFVDWTGKSSRKDCGETE